ncbi:dipicolinic acid synthetase subunit A [Virgibacillus phasianinus]|uniref:Dipicolinic acid synthetase subunit A n=1 Tax=Virgibacillus phasianinus TaxID=2017483 RepID=A0A220U6E5_9BACI|nr:dipicolinic acid synthetase subunit A [Virgibacillus phasianinus]ASK63476.1 dipicolinic acid synthetase subunit A [Virgibacillus phasianinus]
MGYLIAVIGGDARYIELIRQLQKLDNTTICLIGFDKLDQGYTGLKQMEFSELDPAQLDMVILPVTGTDKDGMIDPVFSDQSIRLTKEWVQQLKSTVSIFTGISNDYLTSITSEANRRLVKLFDRNDIAVYNSIPTAEGTIMMVIEHTDFTIHSANVLVVGYGRVGKTIANKFSALGAEVSVCARRSEDLARITEMGFKAIPFDQLSHNTAECDILINTIPAQVITKESIQFLPSHGLIIDLASKPGGTDFEYAEKRGIQAILAKSLPSIVAPKTAGRILADVIKQFITKKEETK